MSIIFKQMHGGVWMLEALGFSEKNMDYDNGNVAWMPQV